MARLANKEILCFAGSDWDNPLWTNRQHIMSRLASSNRVIYIESIAIRSANLTSGADVGRIIRKLKHLVSPLRKIDNNLWVLTPFIIPFNLRCFRFVNDFLLFLQIYAAMKYVGFSSPILWSYLPQALGLIKRFKFSSIIYHCVDEYPAIPGVSRDYFKTMEDEFIRQSGVVFVTSLGLLESKGKLKKETFYLPNVADYELFSKARAEVTKIPAALANAKKNIIGYVGNLCDHKVDIELLIAVADTFRESDLVIVGPIWGGDNKTDLLINDLKSHSNVIMCGAQSRASLPGFLKSFNVCLVPYKFNNYTKNCFPLKIHEYLASGKPVVASALSAIRDYSEVIYFSATKGEFLGNIRIALSENDNSKRDKRIQLASQNTWENRILSMDKILSELRLI